MKTKGICLMASIFLFGCSKAEKNPLPTNRHQPSQTIAESPFQPVVVESPVTEEVKDISTQVATLFTAKKYDKIDELAAEFRKTKEHYASGAWKLDAIYNGLKIPATAANVKFETHITNLRGWTQMKPDSITARVALAENLVGYAMKARGGGYANTVTDVGWRLFSQRLNQALQVLNEAEKIKEKCPHYWVIYLTAASALQLDSAKIDDIFNRATTDFSGYTPVYLVRANFLQPKWGGSEGAWVNDLTKSADKIGGENGDVLYAQVIWFMNTSQDVVNPFKKYNVSWDRLKRGFDILEKEYPDSLALISKRADLASQTGDRATAMKYYQMTGGKVDLTVWRTQDNYDGFVKWLFNK